jgi:glycine cleavage system H protein
VVEVNAQLASAPAQVNEDALGAGWFLKIKISNRADLNTLMDEAAYAEFIATLS